MRLCHTQEDPGGTGGTAWLTQTPKYALHCLEKLTDPALRPGFYVSVPPLGLLQKFSEIFVRARAAQGTEGAPPCCLQTAWVLESFLSSTQQPRQPPTPETSIGHFRRAEGRAESCGNQRVCPPDALCSVKMEGVDRECGPV